MKPRLPPLTVSPSYRAFDTVSSAKLDSWIQESAAMTDDNIVVSNMEEYTINLEKYRGLCGYISNISFSFSELARIISLILLRANIRSSKPLLLMITAKTLHHLLNIDT